MKSMKPKRPFTQEDFEKGLMLLGLLLPSSEQDVKEKEALEQFEKEQGTEKQQRYFQRVVLAAEIVGKLYTEPTLGRVKFQKLVYLCEYAADMELAHRYQKQTAGPFDHKFMHSVDEELKRNKWFESKVISSGEIKRTVYQPMSNADGYKGYYNSYFGQLDESIQHVIHLFRRQSTDKTELAATVHFCLCELATTGQPVSQSALIKLFYNWSKAKSKFSEQAVLESAKWLKQNGLTDIEISK
jgi:uncharacterized protein YwgA